MYCQNYKTATLPKDINYIHRIIKYFNASHLKLFKGEKDKNIADVQNFNLVLPTREYHNCIWTWFDLLMTMKNDSKRVLISQVNILLIKQSKILSLFTAE